MFSKIQGHCVNKKNRQPKTVKLGKVDIHLIFFLVSNKLNKYLLCTQ